LPIDTAAAFIPLLLPLQPLATRIRLDRTVDCRDDDEEDEDEEQRHWNIFRELPNLLDLRTRIQGE
jgi:hypothetical protein